ncbi:MAG: hypothetical protein IT381_25555 [Deltaproteobacteria bacterium]|nr:hypothetical protein [Deltaproteobacteria bacterium]
MKPLASCLLLVVTACGPRSSNSTGGTCSVVADVQTLGSDLSIASASPFLVPAPTHKIYDTGSEIAFFDPAAGATVGLSKAGQILAVPKGTPGAVRVVYEPIGQTLIDLTSAGGELLVMQTASRTLTPGSSVATVEIYSLGAATPMRIAEAPMGTTWSILFSRFIFADPSNIFIQATVTDNATSAETQQIIRIQRGGGGAQTSLVSKPSFGLSNAQKAGDYIYFTSKQGFGAIYRVATNASAPGTETRLTSATGGVDDDAKCLVPYFDTSGIYCLRVLQLVKLDPLAMNPTVLRDDATLTPSPPNPGRVGLIDGDRVYLMVSASNTKAWPLQRITTSGGAAIDIACDRRIVQGITADSAHVYWVERAKSDARAAIYRAPR